MADEGGRAAGGLSSRRSGSPPKLVLGALAAILCARALYGVPAQAADLDPAGRALARPALDPDAEAEIIRWDVRVVDGVVAQGFDRLIESRRAVMVYSPRAAEQLGVAAIPFDDDTRIEFVSVTVTTPGGRRRTLQPEQMFDREVARIGKVRLRERRYSVPGLEAGSLVETYSRIRSLDGRYLRTLVVPVQEDIPLRSFVLRVRAWREESFTLRTNGAASLAGGVTVDADGYRRLEVRDLPARRREPLADAEWRTRLIVLGLYGDPVNPPRMARFTVGTEIGKPLEAMLPVDDSVRVAAARIAPGDLPVSERIERLFRWCRTGLRNLSATDSSARSELGVDDRPRVTLANGASDAQGVNVAFAALAIAAGLDVRLAVVVDGMQTAFGFATDPRHADRLVVVIADRGRWRWFDPGDPVHPPDFVEASLEGCTAYLLGKSVVSRTVVPRAPGRLSREERTASLHWSAAGGLQGTIETTYHGHLAALHLAELRLLDRAERNVRALSSLRSRWTEAEADSFEWRLPADGIGPVGWRCRVRIPDYATLAGTTALVPLDPWPPVEARLTEDTLRTQPVKWPFAWTEALRVRLTLPEGARAIAPGLPDPLSLPEGPKVSATCRIGSAGGHVEFEREQAFGSADSPIPAERWKDVRGLLARCREIALANIEVEIAPDR